MRQSVYSITQNDKYFPFWPYDTNRIYKHPEAAFYTYKNQLGYIHVLRPQKVKMNGKTLYYIIIDEMLTKKETLKESGEIGQYNTIEECITALEKMEGEYIK